MRSAHRPADIGIETGTGNGDAAQRNAAHTMRNDDGQRLWHALGGLALDPDKPVARYYQIAQHLRDAITSGTLLPGTALPSEQKLGELFGVSRPTVRQAIQLLTEEGLLDRRQGAGTFVRKLNIQQRHGRVIGFSRRMSQDGLCPSSRVLENRILRAQEAGEKARTALNVPATAQLLRLSRLRLISGEPVALETAHLPLDRFPGLNQFDLEHRSLYQTLEEHYDTEITFFRESLEPMLMSVHEATLLWTQPGLPAMLATFVTYDQAGAPVEYTYSLVPGDRCRFELEFLPGKSSDVGEWKTRQTQVGYVNT